MTKNEIRARLLAAREARSVFDVESAAVNLAEWMYRLPMTIGEGETIGCYLPIGSEPGSDAMLEALVDQGFRVIAPVVPDGDPQPLQWAVFTANAPLQTKRWGLAEPTSRILGPDALAEASLVFVPALAVTRDGARLGRGAGYYDRSLTASTAVRVAIVYDDEILDALPVEPTDIPMEWALTPDAGFLRLPAVTN